MPLTLQISANIRDFYLVIPLFHKKQAGMADDFVFCCWA
jgi:hypothetical protein